MFQYFFFFYTSLKVYPQRIKLGFLFAALKPLRLTLQATVQFPNSVFLLCHYQMCKIRTFFARFRRQNDYQLITRIAVIVGQFSFAKLNLANRNQKPQGTIICYAEFIYRCLYSGQSTLSIIVNSLVSLCQSLLPTNTVMQNEFDLAWPNKKNNQKSTHFINPIVIVTKLTCYYFYF